MTSIRILDLDIVSRYEDGCLSGEANVFVGIYPDNYEIEHIFDTGFDEKIYHWLSESEYNDRGINEFELDDGTFVTHCYGIQTVNISEGL